MYQLPGVSATCDLLATQQNYYTSLFPLNPSGITPITPSLDLYPVPHRRNIVSAP